MPELLLIDLDGTVYTSAGAIDGAVEALDALRADGHVLRFLTNTDSKSTPQMLAAIAEKGLSIGAEELFTSVTAVEQLLSSATDVVLLPLTNDAVADQLTSRYRGQGTAPTHVVVGDLSERLSYGLMDDAFRALRGGAALIALQKGRFYLVDGAAHLDTGAFVAALEYGAGVEAVVVGKPNTSFLDLAVASTGTAPAPERIWVVGDDVTTDIRMGKDAGTRTVLVRTGKYGHQRDLADTSVPEYVADSLADLPALLNAASR